MNFHFDKSVDILVKTLPFVLLRLAVYGLALVGSILWFGGLYLLFQNWPFFGPSWLAWVFGGLIYGKLFRLIRSYLLYLVKAGHIAVITRLLTAGELPAGTGQISFGKDLVASQFVKVSILFGIDRLVNLILRAFNRSIFNMLNFIPGLGAIRNLVQRVLDYSAGYVDEAILSYSLLYPQRNPWVTAREGLILYVQNWKSILGSGVILGLLSYALVAVVAAPGVLLATTLAGPFTQLWIAVSVGLGLLAKFVVMDPFALTSVIVNFHAAIEGQVPDPEWERKLESVSSRFKELKDQAATWGFPGEAAPPPPPGYRPAGA